MRRPIAIILVLALLAPSVAEAAVAPFSASPAHAAAAAKKKKRTCLVKRRIGGKLVQVYQRKRILTVVNRGGQLVVTKRLVYVKKRGPCKTVKRCVIKKRVNGKLVTVYRTVVRRVRKRRRGKVIVVKRKVKVPKKGKCPKKTTAPSSNAGTPITLTLSPGSNATLDFAGDGSFVRTADLSGVIKGFTTGPLLLNAPNTVNLSSADLHVASTNIFVDDQCSGTVSPTIRTGDGTVALLDDSAKNTSTVDTVAQTITAIVHLRLRVNIELRDGEDGCGKDYIKTGYTEMRVQALFKGKLDTTGGNLTAILDSNQALVDDATACVSPGDPTQPCNGFVIPFPFLLSSHVVAAVALGS